MAYQKTAKDKAWDKERQKLRSEISDWIIKCGQKEYTIQCQTDEITILKNRIEKLERTIAYLTEGKATPDEVLEKMKKQSELCDMMKFLMNGTREMFYGNRRTL